MAPRRGGLGKGRGRPAARGSASAVAAAAATKSSLSPSFGGGGAGDDGSGASVAGSDRKRPRQQNVLPPVTLDNWASFVMSRNQATDYIEFFGLQSDASDLAGMGFEELCEAVADPVNGDIEEWKEWYEDTFQEAPRTRWSKTQIIQALSANYLQ